MNVLFLLFICYFWFRKPFHGEFPLSALETPISWTTVDMFTYFIAM